MGSVKGKEANNMDCKTMEVGKPRIRQIVVDIIPEGSPKDGEICRAVEKALTDIGCRIVGGPDFADASWSAGEYAFSPGANESNPFI